MNYWETFLVDSEGHDAPGYLDVTDQHFIPLTPFISDGLASLAAVISERLDEAQTVLFARQLEGIESKLYEVKLRNLRYQDVLPMSSEPGPGAEQITYYLYSKVGIAKIIASGATDLPRVDIFGTRHTANIRPGGAAFGYTTQELRRAVFGNVPLDSLKVSAARRSMEELENRIAWNGDSEFGLLGLLDNPNVPNDEVALNEATTSRLWTLKTADEIIEDVSDLLSNVRTVTKQVHQANILLLPLAQYELIRRKRISPINPHMTVFKYLLDPENGQGLTAIEPIVEMEGAGEGGTDLMLAYENDPEVLEFRLPMPMQMLPIERRNLELIVNLESEIGGVVVRYPLAVRGGFGI